MGFELFRAAPDLDSLLVDGSTFMQVNIGGALSLLHHDGNTDGDAHPRKWRLCPNRPMAKALPRTPVQRCMYISVGIFFGGRTIKCTVYRNICILLFVISHPHLHNHPHLRPTSSFSVFGPLGHALRRLGGVWWLLQFHPQIQHRVQAKIFCRSVARFQLVDD